MKGTMIGYLFLSIVFSAFAQTPCNLTTTKGQLGDGRATLTIKNNCIVPLTAFAVTSSSVIGSRRSASRMYRDFAMTPMQPAIAPGGQKVLVFGIKGSAMVRAELRAGIFENGTVFGDPDWVQMLLRRRAYYVETIDAALKVLQQPLAQDGSREVLVQRLVTLRDALLLESRPSSGDGSEPPMELTPQIRELFVEETAPLKAANLRFVSAHDRGECTRQVFTMLVRNITQVTTRRDGSPMILSDLVNDLVSILNGRRLGVLKSHPAMPVL
ncbi:MAG: hypothetical protein LLG20_10140 [Acidobacteriales bacterium]|nr:hypothetical protein [Terriglobales bacterium]